MHKWRRENGQPGYGSGQVVRLPFSSDENDTNSRLEARRNAGGGLLSGPSLDFLLAAVLAATATQRWRMGQSREDGVRPLKRALMTPGAERRVLVRWEER